MVMLLPYQNQSRKGWKPSGNRYNGTYGLQVWEVAQLVEQETIPSPGFDSWLSNSLIWEIQYFLFMVCRNTGHFHVS